VHECGVILASDGDTDPSQFNYKEWIRGGYTEDGQTVYGLIHMEYQGWIHPGQCSVPNPAC